MLSEFLAKHKLSKDFEGNALKRFIPLSQQIIEHQNGASEPFFVGLNGCQGSGKSTLSDFLKSKIEKDSSLRVITLSLDDFYLSKSDRMALAVKIHPLFETRGVPGTHDTNLLNKVLHALKASEGVSIPRFDKSTDNPVPSEQWEKITGPVDVVILEGWCWGVEHQPETQLLSPINDLEANEDMTGVWRHFVNRQLTTHYEPLYSLMDYWIMLKAPSFDHVYAWRLEQEQKLIDATRGEATMDDGQIKRFIQYFQRLTEHGLATLPVACDLVYELDAKRRIQTASGKDLS